MPVSDEWAAAGHHPAGHERDTIRERKEEDPQRGNRRKGPVFTLREIDREPAQREAQHEAARIAQEHARLRLPREAHVEEQEATKRRAEDEGGLVLKEEA